MIIFSCCIGAVFVGGELESIPAGWGSVKLACCSFYNEKHERHETIRTALRLATDTFFAGLAQPRRDGL